ncbi:MAG: HAMP domain-containing histidine kinase [Blastochloris sp.]|nr:HAMP domain-containing histidine kinase [Blastochloris sp.]
MRPFTLFQRFYIVITTVLSIASMATLNTIIRPLAVHEWIILLGLAGLYGLACHIAVEIETSIARSQILLSIEDMPLLAALLLIGPAALPVILVVETGVRTLSRRRVGMVRYLFNANSIIFVSLTVLTVRSVTIQDVITRLTPFPGGTLASLSILLSYVLASELYGNLLVAVGVRDTFWNTIRTSAWRTLWITPLPPAVGLLSAVLLVIAPGLLLIAMIIALLGYFALRAVVTWLDLLAEVSQARDHLAQQVADATAELRASNAALAAAEERFYTGVVQATHDSTSLLNRALRVVEQRQGTALEQLHDVSHILTRLREQQSDVLTGAQLRYQTLPIHGELIDLNTFVAESVAGAAAEARALGIALTFDGAETGLVKTDPRYLRRVLDNLLANAIKYTAAAAERRIVVQVAPAPADADESPAAWVTITDTGIGIDPETLARLGMMGVRARNGDRSYTGYGIGIAGAMAIMAALGGDLQIESPGPDRGTIARCRLPLVQPRPTSTTA